MRSIILLLFVISAIPRLHAQQLKVGVFDIDIMVQVMPGYQSRVDSVLEIFVQDSLAQEYSFYQQEYQRLDSSYRRDSIKNKSKGILEMKLKQRNELAVNLMNWEKIAQYRMQQKRSFLAKPFYEKVVDAYKKVVAAKNYDLVLKPNTYEPFTAIDNVFVLVANELKVALPKELISE